MPREGKISCTEQGVREDGEKSPKKGRAEGRSSISISMAQAAIALAMCFAAVLRTRPSQMPELTQMLREYQRRRDLLMIPINTKSPETEFTAAAMYQAGIY